MELNLNKPIVFFDLETTGIKVATDRIVEISLVKIYPDRKQEVYTRRINPGMPIPPRSIEIHSITDEDVKDAPRFEEIAKEISHFIGYADLAGYNSNKFDIPLLVEEFLRADVDFDLKGRRFVDVQNIFHKMEPRTLKAAYEFYCKKDLENHHSAEADAQATYEVLRAQLDKYKGTQIKDRNGNIIEPIINDVAALSNFSEQHETADLIGHLIFNDKKQEVFNFGKHKGKTVEEIFTKEPAYYDWMMKSDFPLSTKRVITAIKLRQFNKGSVNNH